MLNNDGRLLEIDEKCRSKYSYVADQNITMRLRFWNNYANTMADNCGISGGVIALVSVTFQTFKFLTFSKSYTFF